MLVNVARRDYGTAGFVIDTRCCLEVLQVAQLTFAFDLALCNLDDWDLGDAVSRCDGRSFFPVIAILGQPSNAMDTQHNM